MWLATLTVNKVIFFKMASSSGNSSFNVEQSTTNFDLGKELIANQLKKEGIQLWLAPYTQEQTGEGDQFPLVCILFG